MTPSEYDVKNLENILQGQGDWFDAHLFRFLNAVLFKSDVDHLSKILCAFGPYAVVLYEHYGWQSQDIHHKFAAVGCDDNMWD